MLSSADRRTKPKFPTIADVQARLGNIPEGCILSFPSPGTATDRDLLDRSCPASRCQSLASSRNAPPLERAPSSKGKGKR